MPDGARIVSLSGEIDLSNAPAHEHRILESLGGATALVVDLTDVSYFDSTGLRMLDNLAGACEAAKLPMRVVAPDGGRVRLILRICSWPDHLLSETVEEALIAV